MDRRHAVDRVQRGRCTAGRDLVSRGGAGRGSDDTQHSVEGRVGEAMLAYAQNGEALRPEQGYPARLLLPGWEGNASVKWLRRMELADSRS